jgi:nitroreductase/NAD-dependent dihydropyrimidine dehydrogenase PreA subunit
MSLFVIDADKCKRDGLCVAVCPHGIIEMTDKGQVPSPIDGADEQCITCGHCVAVCPHGALSHKLMNPNDCPDVQKGLLPDFEQVEHFLRHRRSVRNYKDEPVAKDVVKKLIRIASFAPSGHNLQPVHWLVIDNASEVRRLAGLVCDWMRIMIKEHPGIAGPMHFDAVVDSWERGTDRILRGAPILIVAHAPQAITTAQSACLIAMTYLELAAAAAGMGACWAGYFNAAATNYRPLIHALALPEGHQSFCAMMLGHKKYAYQRLPLRNAPQIVWR